MIINANSYTLPEIFERVAQEDGTDKKAALLKRFDSRHLQWFVDAMYNRDLSDLKIPEYKKSTLQPTVTLMTIKQAIPRIEAAYRHRDNEKTSKRNLQIALENVTAEEADLLERLIRGEKKINGVSKAVFKKVYPQFFRLSQTGE